jgi:hypothetical protein
MSQSSKKITNYDRARDPKTGRLQITAAHKKARKTNKRVETDGQVSQTKVNSQPSAGE